MNLASSGDHGTATITLAANATACTWTASPPGWLTLSATSGSGTQAITYSAGANNTGTQQSGSIGVSWSGGQTSSQTITQPSAAVPIALAGQNLPAQISSAGGNGFVITVTTTATWSATTQQSWIHITSPTAAVQPQSVTGNGQVVFNVDPNSGAFRPGSISVQGGGTTQAIEVDQAAKSACSISLDNHLFQAVAGGSPGSVNLTASCAWTAFTNGVSWLHITNGTSGPGNATINFTVDSNANQDQRSNGTITVKATADGTTDVMSVSQASGIVVPDFTVTKTSSANAPSCEVQKTGSDPKYVVKCKFDASASTNSAFITNYKFTIDTLSVTLGTSQSVSQPVTDAKTNVCFGPNTPVNTAFPLNVTLTVTTPSGTQPKTHSVSFILPGGC